MHPDRLVHGLCAASIAAMVAAAVAADGTRQVATPEGTSAPAASAAPAEAAESAPPSSNANVSAPQPSEQRSSAPDSSSTPAEHLDLDALEEQLRDTKAMGFFTKLSLKNQMDDLLAQFREYHEGKSNATMTQLRRSYDLLLMKVLSLVQDSDEKLARSIIESREAIWNLLSDPLEFPTLRS